MEYTSRESAVYMTANKTFAIKPKPVKTDSLNPYKVLDQKESKIKLMIQDRTDENNKKFASFNLSFPQLHTVSQASDMAMFGQLSDWKMETEPKIFGEPDKDGYSQVTKLQLGRAEKDSQGRPRKYPWYIMIENGRGIKKPGKIKGSYYLDQASYKCDTSVYVNLRDADMKEMMYWTNRFIEVFSMTAANKMSKACDAFVEEDKTKWSKSA